MSLHNEQKARDIRTSRRRRQEGGRRLRLAMVWFFSFVLLIGALGAWLSSRAMQLHGELLSATDLISPLKAQISNGDPDGAATTVGQIKVHTSAATELADDPIWAVATTLPGLGPNFSAVGEVARSADDVANLALGPLVGVYSSLDWESLLPSDSGSNLQPLEAASPTVTSAAHAVSISAERLNNIDTQTLLPQVAEPVNRARIQLEEVTGALDAAAGVATVAPKMLGAQSPRSYLLMVQNNAESRSSGGIPGALAVLDLDNGRLSLAAQSSATELGVVAPAIAVDQEQQQIFSGRLGKFMQDVNLTPDFPTAASTAKAMWEAKTGEQVDGVISIDPVALSYILQATGPVTISNPEIVSLADNKLPTVLTGGNVVQTLLSDVYAGIEQTRLQDAYFAGVAQEVFKALADGSADGKGLVDGITRGAREGRVLVWSALPEEQSTLAKYPISGSIAGPSVTPAQFGVYFNDGTGAKMDYYVRRTVQLVKECSKDGYEQTTVRIASTNTAPADAATALPAYVTGNGQFGVPAGFVQTNIVVYGPAQANVETAKVDGQPTSFAPYFHANRPVGVYAVRLAPGESKTVEFTFTKIVQHTEPNVFVTPTVQLVKDVTLPTENVPCG